METTNNLRELNEFEVQSVNGGMGPLVIFAGEVAVAFLKGAVAGAGAASLAVAAADLFGWIDP